MTKKQLDNKLVGFGKYKEKEFKWVAKNDLIFFKSIRKLYYNKYNEEKKKIYDKLENLFVNTGVKENDEEFQVSVAEVVSWLKSKKKNEEILSLLKEKYEDYPNGYSQEVFMHAKTLLRKEFELEKENMVHIHLMRYEQIWDDNFTNLNLDHLKPGFRNILMCEKYLTAIDTLFQKEKLLGIHSKKFKERLKTNANVEQDKKLEFDVNKLNFDQQLRLCALLEKCKPIEKINKEVTSDDEEAATNVVVVEQKQLDNPIQKSKETNVIQDEKEKLKETFGKTYLEVQQNIATSLEDRVREIYEKKFKK